MRIKALKMVITQDGATYKYVENVEVCTRLSTLTACSVSARSNF